MSSLTARSESAMARGVMARDMGAGAGSAESSYTTVYHDEVGTDEPGQGSHGASDAYEASLAAAKSERTRKSLRNVWTALEALGKRRGAEITVASVAREIGLLGLGGPKEQSIRNPEGQIYRDLIQSFVREVGDRRAPRESSGTDHLIAGIEDVKVQAQVRLLVADNVSLRNQVTYLQNAIRRLSPVDLGSGTDTQQDPRASLASPIVSEAERRTLREFLNNLGEIEGVTADMNSGSLRGTHFDIAGPGFLHLMKRLAG